MLHSATVAHAPTPASCVLPRKAGDAEDQTGHMARVLSRRFHHAGQVWCGVWVPPEHCSAEWRVGDRAQDHKAQIGALHPLALGPGCRYGSLKGRTIKFLGEVVE